MEALQTSRIQASPRDLFVHLFTNIMLYTAICALLSMLFHFIDIAFPGSKGQPWEAPLDSVRMAVATLVFAFPAYFFAARFLARDLATSPHKLKLRMVRGLFYLTVFLGGLTLIGDLIDFFYYFLCDQLTVPYVLKVLTVLIVIGAVFLYYLNETRQPPEQFLNLARPFAVCAVIAVATCLIAGLAMTGPTMHRRFSEIDAKRLADLKILQSRVLAYWRRNGSLPGDQVGADKGDDLANNRLYQYTKIGEKSFQLCTYFLTVTRGHPEYETFENNWGWEHAAGRCCFSRDMQSYRPGSVDAAERDSPVR
jgi:hypothetical protein